MGTVHKNDNELVLVAKGLLNYAKTILPGESDVALSIQWGYASLRFHALTGLTLTKFYIGL
jgi:hypothetical protein